MTGKRIILQTTCIALSTLLALAACNPRERAVFVTKTNVGIDADTKPPNIGFAWDRFEGFLGPADVDGNMPAVVGVFRSRQSLVDPYIAQVYATGQAAIDVTHDPKSSTTDEPEPISMHRDDRHVAFFATSSIFGLKLSWDGSYTPTPDSISLGYKRKEMSSLPIAVLEGDNPQGPSESGKTNYPSTFAFIEIATDLQNERERSSPDLEMTKNADTTADGTSANDDGSTQEDGNSVGLTNSLFNVTSHTFFATGVAAKNLARGNENARKLISLAIQERKAEQEQQTAQQEAATAQAIRRAEAEQEAAAAAAQRQALATEAAVRAQIQALEADRMLQQTREQEG